MQKNIYEDAYEKYPELIQDEFYEIINNLGFENFCFLIDQLGGSITYIPTKKRMFGNCIKAKVLEEFNGGNLKLLARKYELSERTIRNYIEDK